jgi:hypothetical protein
MSSLLKHRFSPELESFHKSFPLAQWVSILDTHMSYLGSLKDMITWVQDSQLASFGMA